VAYWQTLHSDADAAFDAVVKLDAADIAPHGFSIMTEHKPVVGVAC
jgi:homoaconitase/3-isopropylmalate dehydratase large subunit